MVSEGAFKEDQNNAYYNSWAQALSNSTLALLLSENPQVQMILLHCLVANSSCYSALTPSDPFSLASTGRALSLIEKAALGATMIVPLNFSNDYNIVSLASNSSSIPPYPMVIGAVFEDDASQKNSIVINLSNQEKTIDFSSLYSNDATFIQYSSLLGTKVNGDNIKISSGKLHTENLVLQPYSIVLIQNS